MISDTRRYVVYIGETIDSVYDDGAVCKQILVNNFRRAERGEGAAGFRVLKKNLTTYEEQWQEVDTYSLIKKGNFVRISDRKISDENTPESTVFLGYIDGVVREVDWGKDQWQGSMNAVEIGTYFGSVPLLNSIRDENGKILETPPNFNPLIDGYFYANKVADSNKFLVSGLKESYVDLTTGTPKWREADLPNVWSRADILGVLNDLTNISIDVPDEETNPWLHDKEYPTMFDGFDGYTVNEYLDYLLEEPHSYQMKYNSSAGLVEISIFTKTATDIGKVPASTRKVDLDILKYGQRASLTISDATDPVEQVIARGNRILCCGTMTPWFAGGGDTLEKNWTDLERDIYVKGAPYDETLPTDADAAAVSEQFRLNNLTNVYRYFKFKDHGKQAKLLRTANPGLITSEDSGSLDLFAFCPRFVFEDENEANALIREVYDVPLPKYILDGDEGSPQNHSTPNIASIEFEPFIPVREVDTIYKGGEDTSGEAEELVGTNTLMEPRVFAVTYESLLIGGMYWYDILKSPTDLNGSIEFVKDGLILDVKTPQYLAWNDQENAIFTGEDGIVYRGAQVGEWTEGFPGSLGIGPGKNPDEDLVNGVTHWQRLLFTFAVRSDQRVQAKKTKLKLTSIGPDGIPVFVEESNPKNKRIIDTDYELWFVAGGTVISTLYDELGENPGLDIVRMEKDTFTRNDTPRLKEIAESAYNYLSVDRKSVTIELPVQSMNIQEEVQVGDYLISVVDRVDEEGNKQKHVVNSTVSSIEVIADTESPRYIITTEIPAEPLFKELLR